MYPHLRCFPSFSPISRHPFAIFLGRFVCGDLGVAVVAASRVLVVRRLSSGVVEQAAPRGSRSARSLSVPPLAGRDGRYRAGTTRPGESGGVACAGWSLLCHGRLCALCGTYYRVAEYRTMPVSNTLPSIMLALPTVKVVNPPHFVPRIRDSLCERAYSYGMETSFVVLIPRPPMVCNSSNPFTIYHLLSRVYPAL